MYTHFHNYFSLHLVDAATLITNSKPRDLFERVADPLCSRAILVCAVALASLEALCYGLAHAGAVVLDIATLGGVRDLDRWVWQLGCRASGALLTAVLALRGAVQPKELCSLRQRLWKCAVAEGREETERIRAMVEKPLKQRLEVLRDLPPGSERKKLFHEWDLFYKSIHGFLLDVERRGKERYAEWLTDQWHFLHQKGGELLRRIEELSHSEEEWHKRKTYSCLQSLEKLRKEILQKICYRQQGAVREEQRQFAMWLVGNSLGQLKSSFRQAAIFLLEEEPSLERYKRFDCSLARIRGEWRELLDGIGAGVGSASGVGPVSMEELAPGGI